jgi:hypothetical protein
MTVAGDAHANGELGIVAMCSTQARAQAAADAALACGPKGLAIYLGGDHEPSVVHALGDVRALTDAVDVHADVALHEVTSRRIRRFRRTWALGTTTPGVTRLYLIRAQQGLSADDFNRYWEREHAPRALRHHLGMADYTQILVTRTIRGDAIDGITLTQWPQAEDLADRFTDGPVGDHVIHHDAAQFVNLERLSRHRMEERLLIESPWPTSGVVHVTDARSHTFDVPAGDVWSILGRFDRVLDWWPGGFTACAVSSELRIGMTRALTRNDGSVVMERLLDYRPDERMLNLVLDSGLPETILAYTCRYEVRLIDSEHCRLDWYPCATVQADAVDIFERIVDRGWSMVVDGLTHALAVE